jgi:ATP-dependent DNA helicase RecQ
VLEPLHILERYWNYSRFRPLQEEVITAVLNNEDCFVLMPTGGGKSLCYQIPALIKEGICIVVSPLIALMKDQVQALKEKNIKAIALTSDYTFEDVNRLLDNCIYGNYKFLYLSPERLQQEFIQNKIQQMKVSLIAVDEAHCISQWGNDFRPAYRNIITLKQLQPNINTIALTATATQPVVEDVMAQLDLVAPRLFKQSFFRDNLAYMVFEVEDKYFKIEQILNKNPESSIIYVRNRKSTIAICEYLKSKNITSTIYHGGLNHKERAINLELWKNDTKQVMVATSAFGMGIDKANVKTVIHVNLPESLESYFQEAGRAGRNGKKAYAIILKHISDENILKNQFLSVLPGVNYYKKVYRKLCNYFQISYGEGEFTTFNFNFSEFCSTYKFNTLKTYNVLSGLDRNSIVHLTKQFQNQTKVQVVVSNELLQNYIKNNTKQALVMKTILRTYSGIFDFPATINLKLMVNKSGISEQELIKVLKQLDKAEIISLDLYSTDAELTFLVPREDNKTINRIAKTIEQQNRVKVNQVHSVIDYANNDSVCKSKQLLSYFGEKNAEACGICSVCTSKVSKQRSRDGETMVQHVLELLENDEFSSRDLAERSKINEGELFHLLKHLLEEKRIEITPHNTYKLK